MIDILHDIRSDKLEGSCAWVKEPPSFKAWHSACWGICQMEWQPGYRKSTIVTHLVEDLTASNNPVGYFFCSEQHQKQSWRDIICTWIWQLLQARPSLRGAVSEVYTSTAGRDKPLSSYFQALVLPCKKAKPIPYLFLDGLDENKILQGADIRAFSSHLPQLSTCSKLFITPRPESWINKALASIHKVGLLIRLSIADNSNRADISQLFDEGIQGLGLDEPTSKKLHQKLTAGAENMFLWAKLMLREFEGPLILRDIRETLDGELSKDLNGVYTRIFQKFVDMPRSQAKVVAKALHLYAASHAFRAGDGNRRPTGVLRLSSGGQGAKF